MPAGSPLPIVAWQSPKARRLIALTAVLGSMFIASRMLAHRLLLMLMYHPSSYKDDPSHELRLREFQKAFRKFGYTLAIVDYEISARDSASRPKQQAFLVHPEEAPVGLWALFGGNAMLATDWLEFLLPLLSKQERGARPAFLLVDYPGYGANEGSPSPDSFLNTALAAIDGAMPLLAGLPGQLHLLGHSLGSAAAVRLAALPRQREKSEELSPGILLLSAPFLSTVRMAQVMARQLLGVVPPAWFLRLLVSHQWDTQSTLPKAAAHGWRTRIIHGIHDEIVPFSMGIKLHEDLQRRAYKSDFIEAQSGHNDLLSLNFADFVKLMDTAPASAL